MAKKRKSKAARKSKAKKRPVRQARKRSVKTARRGAKRKAVRRAEAKPAAKAKPLKRTARPTAVRATSDVPRPMSPPGPAVVPIAPRPSPFPSSPPAGGAYGTEPDKND